MTNLAVNVVHRTGDANEVQSFIVKNAQQLYAGSLVMCFATDGLLDNYDGSGSGSKLAGLLLEDVLGNTSATPKVTAKVDVSGRKLIGVLVTNATQAFVGERVYCLDGNALTGLTTTANAAVNGVGWLARYGATTADCDVVLFKPDKFAV